MSEKVFQVCKELYRARAYNIYDEGKSEQDGWYIYGKDQQNENIFLFIIMYDKLNIEVIKYYYNILNINHIKHMILVYKNSITVSVKKLIQTLDVTIELFHEDELKFNILNHVLVPQHTLVNTVKKYDNKYPILKRTDPVARFLGYKYGDIIRIDRKDKSISYRFVK